ISVSTKPAAAQAAYLTAGALPATATGYVRELREFYTLPVDTLWITFARGHLWWAFSEPEVTYVGGTGEGCGTRFRPVIGSWRNTDVNGRPLAMTTLSSKLTQLASYRRTICGVAASDYLLRKINAQEEPAVATARTARDALMIASIDLIRQLHWADFELLVDLIFSRAGWRRVSALGGTMKDIDLLLEQPLINERASVQVKSAADQKVLNASVCAFEADDSASRFFFVCHSPRSELIVPETEAPVHLWTVTDLAAAAVDQGLTNWLLERAA
ncbi:restriction endonuclease, partial [Sphingosinicella rhizophila]